MYLFWWHINCVIKKEKDPMRKVLISILTVMVFVLASASCKKIIRNLFKGIDADVPKFTVTIPAVPFALPVEVPLGTYSQPFNLDSTVRANTGGVYGSGDVSSVKIKQIVFNLPNADSMNNVANFESARFTFSSDVRTNTVTVASITFPDTYASTFTYTPVNSPELKPYLNGSKLYYNVFGKLRRATTKELPLSILVTLRVE